MHVPEEAVNVTVVPVACGDVLSGVSAPLAQAAAADNVKFINFTTW